MFGIQKISEVKMKFKNGQLFWGFLFLTIGSLFLLDKNNYNLFIPNNIIDYWPVLIILWGIAILLKDTILKPIVSIITGIFLGLFLYASVFGFHYNSNNGDKNEEISTSEFYENYIDSTQNATISIRTGMGKISVAGTTDKLISGVSTGINNSLNFSTRYSNNNARIVLRHIKEEFIFGNNNHSNLEFCLNPNPVWIIDLQVGAANVIMDLSEYKVAEFNLETGATTSELTFGDKEELVKLNIEMGAATLKIRIPRESACQIKGDMVLVSRELEGFNEVDQKRYQTENFETAKNKIFINFDGGVSTLKIEKY
ncbi:MAG: hypothetical protein COW71_11855 [Ignavibacteriales bacterium CG18_big_fil_WC_8_21_14_2_50_31_20]|nr:MAG: hypothetical protein COW71_11855 [Ignavibacteriales bacterium CG18_big_fil_WC_8_21_14_2_50_31_20]